MQIDTLEKLAIEQLKDLYNAEKQILRALPKMIKAASNADLKQAFQNHLEQTEEHVDRLETVFEEFGKTPQSKKCVAMEGLIAEGNELIQEKPAPDVLDAGLIAAAQRVEHYEMAAYGCLRTYAKALGLDKAAKLLQKTLDEEGETDKSLTRLAESTINVEAMNEAPN